MALFSRDRSPASAEKRQEPRQRVQLYAKLVSADGARVFDRRIHDISKSGAGINVPEQRVLPRAVYLVDVWNRMAYEAKVVWKRPPAFGLEFSNVYVLAKLTDRRLQFLRQICTDAGSGL